MPEKPEDREGQEEEFEPLEEFFAPIEDVDWPEKAEGGAGTKPKPSTTEPLLDDDILPTDIPDDPLAGVEIEGEPLEPTSELPDAGYQELRLDVGEGEEPVQPATPWEDEDDGSAPGWTADGDQDLATTEAGTAYPEPEEERELSLEDLKTPPPEYADLPGPPGDEPALDGGGVVGEEIVDVETDAPQEPEAEPQRAEVEAAADHFAEALREEPELPGEPAPLPEPPRPMAPAEQVEQDLLSDLEREPAPPPKVTVGVTDTLAGPSWQEPTSEDVSAGPAAPPGGGRNLPLAFLSGIVLVAIGIGSMAWGKAPFTVVAGAVIVLAQGELYAALHRRGYQPATALGLVFGGLIAAASYLRGEPGALAMFALGTVLTFVWFMAVPAKARRDTLVNIAMTLLPVAYVGLLGGYVMTILALPGGRTLTLSVVGLAVGYDILAFAAGSLWGQRPLAPSISPRKSWEGAIGATMVVLVVSVGLLAGFAAFKFNGTSGVVSAVGLGIIVSIFAPLGDLAESMLKRDLELKDMGSLIPGHGGVLDRIDSILFVAPAAFYFFRLVLF